MPKMKYGFIYAVFSFIINIFGYLNLVELFKFIAGLFNTDKTNPDKISAFSRTSTDVFIVLKWVFIFYLWHQHISNSILTVIVWYLLVTNIYTYFFYHVWDNESLNTANFTIDRSKRRFLNLLLAVAFSTATFAYLLQVPYCANFHWK